MRQATRSAALRTRGRGYLGGALPLVMLLVFAVCALIAASVTGHL